MFKKIFLLFCFIFVCILLVVGVYFKANKTSVVRVKGLSEKDVVADKAYWNISFINAGINLETIQTKGKKDLDIILEFLKSYSLTEEEITVGILDMIDLDSREYKDPNQKNKYILTQSVLVETNKIDVVEKIARNVDTLIKNNISLKSNGYNEGIKPVFIFTKINDIKEEMITEAIKNAEKTAKQFAINSKSKIFKIKNADQGTFIITSKNKSSGDYSNEVFSKEKQVRVVLTVEYWLK